MSFSEFFYLLIALITVNSCGAKIVPIVYEDFEECVETEEKAGKFDYSEMEIIAESDYHVCLNGTLVILDEVKSPWKVTLFAERLRGNKWVVDSIHRRVPDFCTSIQSITEPWYHVTSKFDPKNCPFPRNVSYSCIEILKSLKSATKNFRQGSNLT